ncbi:MAG: PrgI family protein, partial [Oscillospiraceae bacterium]|nr:PrgI family protein [Oscillospiraceae bacterium]
MYKDGICHVSGKLYTKTVMFSDINYHLAQNEDKTQIFEKYCDFLNYFDSSVTVQLSFINQHGNPEEFNRSIDIPARDDSYDDIRREYADMLKNQMAKGNNGLVRTKYITFGIEADSFKAAKMRVERVEADILNSFKVLGVAARPLSGAERLEVMHGQLHPDGKDKFLFSWKDLAHAGLSTKDYIAPSGFDFRDGRSLRIGTHYGAVSFLQILAPELTDRMLADFIDLDSPTTVTLHVRSIDQSDAIKMIKRKLSDLEKMKIEEQKKAVRAGYDMDILPTDLVTYGTEAKTLLEDLQSRNERMFLVTVLVMNTAERRQKLEDNVFSAAGVAQKYNCALKRLDWQQEQGLMSSLPLGVNQLEIKRGLTTSSVAIFIPFTTCELFQRDEALYYGLNALSNNLIMASRKALKNPNGLFLGTPGCFTGETKIRLAGGKTISLAELEQSGVDEATVRAYDETTGEIVDAKAVDIRISKHTDTIKNLFMADGSVISCTDTHLFLDAAGQYMSAEDIGDGQALHGGHTVVRVSITKLPQKIPVYDITVPRYMNFVLENGVVAHNSGKSFSAKREIINVFLLTGDDIIISDPEAEYFPLVNRLGGQVIKLSPVSTQYINPMDINPDYSDDEDPLTLKSDFILSLCELIVGGKTGLEPVEKTIIDRCVRLVYRDYLADPSPEKMPILEDLYNLLRSQVEPEAHKIATALEIYVTGSLNVFNHRTNTDIQNRIVCYDIKELGKGLKKIAMLVLQDAVWNRVTANRAKRRTTWFYIDEMHLLLKDEQTAAYTVEIWKRFRKWGGIPSGLTQNVKDFLLSREVENIFENS